VRWPASSFGGALRIPSGSSGRDYWLCTLPNRWRSRAPATDRGGIVCGQATWALHASSGTASWGTIVFRRWTTSKRLGPNFHGGANSRSRRSEYVYRRLPVGQERGAAVRAPCRSSRTRTGVHAAAPREFDGRPKRISQKTSDLQGLASRTRLKGVSVARRKRRKPPWVTTSRRRASPAWAPRQAPTSCERDAGVQMNVEAE